MTIKTRRARPGRRCAASEGANGEGAEATFAAAPSWPPCGRRNKHRNGDAP